MEFLDSWNPNLLAFLSAFTFAAAQIFYRDALRRLTPSAATIIVNATICLCAVLAYLASQGVERWPLMGVFWFAMVGVFGPFLGRYLSYLSITYIGLARTQVMAQTMPLWSAILAVAALGERLGPGVALGTLGILAGAFLLVRERGAAPVRVPLRLYLVSVLGAMCMALTPTLRKLGFFYIPSASFGLALSVGLGAGLHLLGRGWVEERSAGGWERGAALRAVWGSVLNFAAGMLFWTAVKVGDVVAVVPINRLSVFFVLIFSWMFFRKQEHITWRVVAGALLAVAGAVAIAGSR